jgi:tetratricopeptide (TPR) repeat protein
MPDNLYIRSSTTAGRVLLAGSIIFAVVFGWFAMRLQLGSMIADLTKPESDTALPAAEVAMRLAPGDPVSTWLRASLESGDAGLRLFEETVRNSPSDYRWRIELGRAYEQNGDAALAERELKYAVELAPAYAFAHWHLGNFYLRQGRNDEAFAELRRAAESNPTYREQVFSLAWDYFGKDPAMVERLAADTADSRAALSLFFAARGRAAESLRNWNSLTEEEKIKNPEIARSIALGLFQQRHFPEALEFARQLGIDAEARPGAITNGGFERPVTGQEDSKFGWQILRNDAKLDISTDSAVRHEGGRSLKLSFRNFIKPELYNVVQTVVVEANTSYRLSFWIRTENLKSSGPPQLEIVNANDDKVFVTTRSYPAGSNDWQQISVDLKTPENCTAITIRTARSYCGDQCPIVGTVWYDEFSLSRL